MNELGKGFDGTIEKAISSTEKLKGLPEIVQKYMMLGDYKSGLVSKIDGSNFGTDENGRDIQNYVAQISNLDEAQRNAIISVTELGKESKNTIKTLNALIEATQNSSRINGKVFESNLKSVGGSEINQGDVNSLMSALGMKNGDNYALPDTNEVKNNLNMWAKAAENADAKTRLMNAGIIESTKNGYAMTDSFKKMIGIEEVDGVVKTGLTAKQLALNAVMQIGKQLALSFGVAIATWAISKAVEYLMNLKTHSEELVATMNDSHDAAEQATKDVEEIQSKIDELNKSLKDAGVGKIEDIVDPAERERLQAINDMLQAQLELKKQLEKDANDKANADTSAVVNDKTEKSIVKKKTVYLDVNGEPTDNPTEAVTTFDNVGEDITKTESLEEHTAALNELTDKRRELAIAGKEDTQEYKDNEAAITSETEKVKTLSTAVSEQMDGYETDADSFSQYKDEYVAGTNAMTAATKALANAQGDTGIDTTNLDIFSEKIRQIKNDMDNGDSQQSDWKMFNGLDAFSGMTGESIINIDKDTTSQTDAEKAALEKLHQVADDNKISFENLIGVFEAFGIIQTSNASSANSYAEQLEKTMGIIDNIQSAYKTCSTAVEEYNKYGYMSVDSLQSLLQMDDEYLNTLELVNGKLQVNQSAYADLLATQYAEAQMEAISQAISELNAIAKGDAAEKAGTFTEATEDEKNKLEALAPALKNATIGTGELAGALAAARSAEKGDNTEEIEAKISSVMDALNTRLSLISTNMQSAMNSANGLKTQLNGFGDSANKSANDSAKASQTFLDAWSTVTSAMKEFNEQGYLTMKTVQDLTGLEDKYANVLQKNNVTGKLEIQTSKFQELMESEIEEAKIKGDNASEAQYNKILEWTDRNIKKQTMSYWDLVAAIDGYSAALEEAKGITDTFKDAWDNGKAVKEKTEKSRTGALDYEGTEAQSSAMQDLMKYSEYDPELIGKAFNEETGKIDLSGDMLKNAVVKSLEAQATAARTEGGAAAEAIAQSYEKSAENIENDVISVQDYFDGLGSTIDEVNTKIDDIQSAFTDLDDVTNEYNAYGGLSVDAMQKLLTMQPEYLACLEMNGDQLVFNRDKMVELLIAQLEVKKQELASKDETKDQAQIIQQMIDMLKKDGVNAIAGMTYEADKLQTIFSNIKDLFSSLLDLVNSANDKKSNDLKIQGDAWIDVIDKRIDALNEANEAQERAIELQKAEDALAKAQANKTVRVYGENGYEWQADQSAIRDAQSDLSSKRRDYKKQDEIDRLNKLKDKIQENVNLIGSSWDDYQKKLAYTAQFEAMTYDQMVAHNDTFKDAVLANMQAIQSATNVSNVISKLETLIDTLTKLGNVLGNLNGSTTDGGLTGLANRFKRALGALTNKDSGKGLFGRIGDSVKSFFGIGTGTADTASSGLGSIVSKGFQGIGGIFKSGMNIISNAAGNGFSGITGLFSKGMSAIGGAVKGLFGGSGIVGKALTGIGTKVAGVFGAGGTVAKIFGALGTTVTGPVGLAIGALGTAVTWLATSSNGFAKTLREALSSFISGVGSVLASIGKGVGSAVGAVAKGGWTVLKTVGKVVTAPIRWAWNGVKNFLGFASGTKKVKKSGTYNVDEKGEEIIVRRPQKGRVTTLEKGDGVIPANQTETLMGIAKNPIRWLRSNLAKVTGSTAVAVGATKDNADQEAVAQAQETAGKIDSVYSGAFSDIKKVSNAVMKSIKTGSGTIGKSIGSITGIMSGALFGFDTDKISKSSNWLISSIGKAIGKLKDMVGGGSSITGSMDKLLSSSKSKTLAQLDAMKSSFEKTWNEMAEATGVSKNDITATSKEMYDKMTKLVNDTYAAIGDNTALNSEQVEQLTQTLFKSMQSTYTSGWNRIASLTDEMTEEQANKMAIAYKSMSDGCTSTMNSVSKTMANSWNQCGGGVRNLSAKTESTISKAWADTTGNTEKMLYDMRACFDNSWGQAEQGVRNLADNTANTINGAYTSIKSTSDEAMNTKLPSDMANAWKNVEPGATNLSENIKWTMGQAYDNITKGCNDTVTSIKSAFGTAGNDLYNKGQTTDTAKTEEKKKTTTTTTNSSSSSSGSSSSSQPVSGGQSLPDWFKNSFLAGAKEDYKKVKDKVTSSSAYQKASSAVNYVKDKVTSSSAYQKASSVVKDVKEKVSNSKPVKAISSFIDKHKKKASGARKINQPDVYNVDEQGSELMVRQPQAGRYTYLETGDGVVPADITSRLFEMGGNPDAWFQNQMSKYSAPVTSTGGSNLNVSMGNIVIQNPVGSADDLAGEIVRELPNKLSQYMNLR